MEPETPTNTNSGNKMIMPIVIAALVVLLIVGFFVYQSSNKAVVNEETEKQTTQAGIPTAMPKAMDESTSSSMMAEAGEYKDGTYEATGNYVSPGGPREIDVTITVKAGKISDSTFAGKATDNASKRFQGEFSEGYKSLIVGKSLDEVKLTKVAGSSLTPKGFQDALEKIKSEAKS